MPHHIVVKSWRDTTRDEFFDIVRLRAAVFYVEQRIDVEDVDDADRAPDTRHFWIPDESGVAAYLRLVRLDPPEHGARASFGRLAVAPARRGRGLARRLVAAAVEARRGEPMLIHSQAYIAGLYADYGFEPVGEPYREAGLDHIMMLRR